MAGTTAARKRSFLAQAWISRFNRVFGNRCSKSRFVPRLGSVGSKHQAASPSKVFRLCAWRWT